MWKKFMPCGCEIVGDGSAEHSLELKRCALHSAASSLNETLGAIAVEAEFTADDGAMELGEKLLRIQQVARAAVVTVEDEDDAT